MKAAEQKHIIIVDFGSQYTQLIARRVRELGVYSEILPCHQKLGVADFAKAFGIILSGGPASVLENGAPTTNLKDYPADLPILGICYGAQLMVQVWGGTVEYSLKREFGQSEIKCAAEGSTLFAKLASSLAVWMSHGDAVTRLPNGFVSLAATENCPIAAFKHNTNPWYGLQFHPEVVHTLQGTEILSNFVSSVCQAAPTWTMQTFAQNAVEEIRTAVGTNRIICGLSGGVDSAVTAALIHKAVGSQLTCIFVDNGLLRLQEATEVASMFREHFKMDLREIDAKEEFLQNLAGVVDPEEKRKNIGKVFIDVFEREARKIENVTFLAQGTLYPDVIESVSVAGPSATIKSHHNVGGLPEKMNLKLVEPLRYLFKDEVRKLGLSLGLPEKMVHRHPFPGPGLAIRILGAVSDKKLHILRLADAIILDELYRANVYDQVWQAFGVLLPIKSVGVMGDARTYENILALRLVTSVDGMTADWARMDFNVLGKISNRIINEVAGINRVVYDISSKPPATIEWE
jgi:GMP synthase (glutamine-hydrolysing)